MLKGKKQISFQGIICSLKTCKDGGYKITIDVPECDKDAYKELIDIININSQIAVVEL